MRYGLTYATKMQAKFIIRVEKMGLNPPDYKARFESAIYGKSPSYHNSTIQSNSISNSRPHLINLADPLRNPPPKPLQNFILSLEPTRLNIYFIILLIMKLTTAFGVVSALSGFPMLAFAVGPSQAGSGPDMPTSIRSGLNIPDEGLFCPTGNNKGERLSLFLNPRIIRNTSCVVSSD